MKQGRNDPAVFLLALDHNTDIVLVCTSAIAKLSTGAPGCLHRRESRGAGPLTGANNPSNGPL